MKKRLFWLVLIAVVFAVSAWFLGSMKSAPLLWQISGGGKFLFPLILAASIVNSIHPCAFSILLVTIAFLFSIGRLRANILKIGGIYVFGIFSAYVLIGVGVLQAFHLFDVPFFMAKFGAALLIALGGLNLINVFFPGFPLKLRIPQIAHQKMGGLMEKGSLATAFLLGALVGICALPCSGGPYVMILGLLHDQVTYWQGLGYLILYNFIFVLPLIVMLLIASDRNVLDKVQEWQKQEMGNMRFWSGIAMIILGIIIYLV
ncbi:MAG: cytochrome c biogenesis protein CcdA [Candidatus Azambacteria bacterium]|nr:cytochrome c biogenesis protein CcdA [Candidatus Azambacteria bacterium]